MRFIADLHIHSHYSLATSKDLKPEHLDHWARLKGIDVLSTGDCIHPKYLTELQEKFIAGEHGLFRLKGIPRSTNFILTTEISSIYKKKGKVRKIHNLCFFPSIQAAKKVQRRLAAVGNIGSDGRPILGLDAKDLLEIVLESDPSSFLVPAHIWTPWFSVLGARSGFDSIEECFEELSDEIFALETGLSSDPAMNRLCSFLDRFRLVSNSDAHSPSKLGREANIFDTELSYQGIYKALKYDQGFVGTIEFFPQEGKYHYDGHRACGICLDPFTSKMHGGLCPVCGKKLTMGVATRVGALADRETPDNFGKQIYYSVMPLAEMIAESLRVKNSSSKKVTQEYMRIVTAVGSEFDTLLFADIDEIKHKAGIGYAEGIQRLREGRVSVRAGYDGEFGKVSVFGKT
jgi:uncharacterized protein (TIGR00375 family)